MFDRHNLSMSRQQQQLLMAWDKQHPVTAWEKERDNRIAAIMGYRNPFVTGERIWTPGYKPVGDGLVNAIPNRVTQRTEQSSASSQPATGSILGNKTVTSITYQ
jgi:deoxyribonuclease-1